MQNVLFICSENRLRSRTAETIWTKNPNLSVRSAGTNDSAVKTVKAEDLLWADIIIVMEDYHHKKLQANFPGQINGKPLHVLNIPDIYPYMDPMLVQILDALVPRYLKI